MNKYVLSFVALCIGQINYSYASNFGPSFDCIKSRTNVEKSICSSKQLSQLDMILSLAYKHALKYGGHSEEYWQKDWIQNRNKCLSDSCLIFQYQNRIKDLWHRTIYSKREIRCLPRFRDNSAEAVCLIETEKHLYKENKTNVIYRLIKNGRNATHDSIYLDHEENKCYYLMVYEETNGEINYETSWISECYKNIPNNYYYDNSSVIVYKKGNKHYISFGVYNSSSEGAAHYLITKQSNKWIELNPRENTILNGSKVVDIWNKR